MAGSPRRLASVFVRVIVYRDKDQWLAQGLEYDLNAQAPSERQAIQSFVRLLGARVLKDAQLGRIPLAGIEPAPEAFFDSWREDHLSVETATPESHSDIPPAYVIHQVTETSGTRNANS